MRISSDSWTPVLSSSMLTAYRYDAVTQTLDIQFPKAKPGEFYRYYNVPKETFDAFKSAESRGRYFIENIKKGDFKFEKVTKEVDLCADCNGTGVTREGGSEIGDRDCHQCKGEGEVSA